MPDQSHAPPPISNQLAVLAVTCPVGDFESPLDSFHVLDFHVGRPVRVTTRLDSHEQHGLQRPGDFCILPAGLTGQWVMDAPADALLLRLSPLLVEETAAALGVKPAFAKIEPALRIRDPHLEYIGCLLQAEREAGYPDGRLFVDSLATAVAARLLRRYGAPQKALRVTKNQLPRWRLRNVCDYIEANLARDLSLAELANVAGFSVSHFKPLFRQAMGIPVHGYVVERRVERARRLLIRGENTMSEIAFEAGFTHQSHMARCLRRVLGIGSTDIARLRR